jgi:peptidoglycan-associated lipoprotein
LTATLLLAALGAGCGPKKTPVSHTPPASTPVGPTSESTGNTGKPSILSFSVEPSTVERGQSAMLKWSVTGATSVIIDHGIGAVDMQGSRSVVPADSTTYTLTARSEGGSASATTTVNVTPAAEHPDTVNRPRPTGTLESRVASDLQDALFDYDKNEIRGDAQAVLTKDASALKQIFADFPQASVIVEGHCDDRGSAEYNLGLGDRRSSAAKDFLVQLGIPTDKLKTVSYGKERPVCTEGTEDCYQRNRRAHFSVGQ